MAKNIWMLRRLQLKPIPWCCFSCQLYCDKALESASSILTSSLGNVWAVGRWVRERGPCPIRGSLHCIALGHNTNTAMQSALYGAVQNGASP